MAVERRKRSSLLLSIIELSILLLTQIRSVEEISTSFLDQCFSYLPVLLSVMRAVASGSTWNHKSHDGPALILCCLELLVCLDSIMSRFAVAPVISMDDVSTLIGALDPIPATDAADRKMSAHRCLLKVLIRANGLVSWEQQSTEKVIKSLIWMVEACASSSWLKEERNSAEATALWEAAAVLTLKVVLGNQDAADQLLQCTNFWPSIPRLMLNEVKWMPGADDSDTFDDDNISFICQRAKALACWSVITINFFLKEGNRHKKDDDPQTLLAEEGKHYLSQAFHITTTTTTTAGCSLGDLKLEVGTCTIVAEMAGRLVSRLLLLASGGTAGPAMTLTEAEGYLQTIRQTLVSSLGLAPFRSSSSSSAKRKATPFIQSSSRRKRYQQTK